MGVLQLTPGWGGCVAINSWVRRVCYNYPLGEEGVLQLTPGWSGYVAINPWVRVSVAVNPWVRVSVLLLTLGGVGVCCDGQMLKHSLFFCEVKPRNAKFKTTKLPSRSEWNTFQNENNGRRKRYKSASCRGFGNFCYYHQYICNCTDDDISSKYAVSSFSLTVIFIIRLCNTSTFRVPK